MELVIVEIMNRFCDALLIALLTGALPLSAAEKPDEFPPQPAVPYLTAEEELKTFQLPEGYRLELVLGDPVIKEPTIAVFDGNGRMFVGEMRSYMQDIDGKNEHTPVSRVSLHLSSKGDGVSTSTRCSSTNLFCQG